jgi:glycosyltransferase involved in cell wall biosynthesis
MHSAVLAPPLPGRERAMSWVLIAGEYPPQAGGVSDYTRTLARMLAANGDSVTVFAPPCEGASPDDDNVRVERLPDAFGARGRAALSAALAAIPAPRAAIVQYVPQSFGLRGCNVPFAAWLRSLRGYPLWVMFHEVTVTVRPSTSCKYRIQALATRIMAQRTIAAADAAFISTQRWEPLLHALSPHVPDIRCVPEPSNVALHAEAGSIRAIHDRYARGEGSPIFGHFGTYRDAVIRRALIEAVPQLLARAPEASFLFLGAGSNAFAADLAHSVPAVRGRVFGSGALPAEALAAHLAATDVLLQPYEDGVTTRRGSIIAALALGVPVVTTTGRMTEPLWRASAAVTLVADGDFEALAVAAEALALDEPRRTAMSLRARELYAETFAMEHTVAAFRKRAAQERLVAS